MKIILGLVLILGMHQPARAKSNGNTDYKTFENWIKADLSLGIRQAKAENKFLLLYWGAVWCPPCNELKQNVFSKKEFQNQTQNLVKVYVDGDHENAQIVADTYGVSGYPTILLLDRNGKELTRIAESIDMRDFLNAIQTTTGNSASLVSILKKIKETGEISDPEKLQLAYSRPQKSINEVWDNNPYEGSKTLIKQGLSTKSPATVKARLLSIGLDHAFATSAPNSASEKALLIEGIEELLKTSNPIPMKELLLWSAKPALSWLHQQGLAELADRWARKAEELKTLRNVSLDYQLWSIYPQLIHQALLKSKSIKEGLNELPHSLKDKLLTLVRKIDAKATSNYERTAVMSGAASLLFEVGYKKQAFDVLTTEAQNSDTPWYYLHYLGVLQSKENDWANALKSIETASTVTKGKASKIQWLTAEFMLLQKLKPEHPLYGQALRRANEVLDRSFQLAFQAKDGFSGRNLARLKKIKKTLNQELTQKKISLFLRTYTQFKEKCDRIAQKNMKAFSSCRKFFKLETIANKG